ncbi:MAG: HIT domain-containing protein [Helicobacteraceae bacterium]|jgi:diadenosine tetraphosphate (Ap4A) HIT family hydrolase|nr:HIT domain-containing protein [Helicobacteraceae bacterium]
MDYLYAPWRSGYHTTKQQGCVFCDISAHSENDRQNRVLHRDDACFIVMNLYPYTPGHFMIIPHKHTNALEDLDRDIWLHITALAQKGVKLLKTRFGASGVNLGMNLGAAGGAGIAEHIHLHLVPRWIGDTNFITTIGEARVFGHNLDDIYQKMLDEAQGFLND